MVRERDEQLEGGKQELAQFTHDANHQIETERTRANHVSQELRVKLDRLEAETTQVSGTL